ncbi:MAG TPA: nitroreductase family deazaflavin-dependent oxidoreductase [Pseudonocardia sp.]|nr:nitroreductase family deazaflavin-dependent oxidoreductase [Pseudonocardia sp.]
MTTTAPVLGSRRTGMRRRLMAVPVRLYEWGLGPVLGSSLVVLVHRGRRSGLPHRTALEVLEHRPVDGEYRVLSGHGRSSDWFRNLQANPAAELWVGRDRFPVEHRVLAPDEAVRAVRAHLLASPCASSRFTPALWQALREGDQALAEVVASLPVLAFRRVGTLSADGRATGADATAREEA